MKIRNPDWVNIEDVYNKFRVCQETDSGCWVCLDHFDTYQDADRYLMAQGSGSFVLSGMRPTGEWDTITTLLFG